MCKSEWASVRCRCEWNGVSGVQMFRCSGVQVVDQEVGYLIKGGDVPAWSLEDILLHLLHVSLHGLKIENRQGWNSLKIETHQ